MSIRSSGNIDTAQPFWQRIEGIRLTENTVANELDYSTGYTPDFSGLSIGGPGPEIPSEEQNSNSELSDATSEGLLMYTMRSLPFQPPQEVQSENDRALEGSSDDSMPSLSVDL